MKSLYIVLAFLFVLPACAEESLLHDITATQDVSGSLPPRVFMRTLTQSYCAYYEFVISEGKIYAKEKGESEWKPFLKTGLPFSKSNGGKDAFEPPAAICELCCDADSLCAFDEDGVMYSCFISKTAPQKPFRWRKLCGFPRENFLVQNDLVKDKRGWSMGCRRGEILWYEDRYGNQHHYGTMGLETFYFLTKDGQRIRFTDSGLPTDFSRSIQGPEGGRFIAENISVSGDTIFLIGDRGSMYTRLIDFDTMGCDPVFFQYTYEKLTQYSSGTDYLSNYSPWALPAEDWLRQPSITLSGAARISKVISIAQTGRGNAARELRVAGTDASGTVGYYHKMLFDSEWLFSPAPLTIAEEFFLKGGAELGEDVTFSYRGYISKNNNRLAGYTCTLSGAALSSEDRCTLTLSKGDESFSCALYPVEKWTYIRRYNPGFDGTPRYYFITAALDEWSFSSYSKDFRRLLETLFKGRNLKLFDFAAEASTEYYQIDIAEGGVARQNVYTLFMTGSDEGNVRPFVFKAEKSMRLAGIGDPLSADLVLSQKELYSDADREEISVKLAANKEYLSRLHETKKEQKKFHEKALRSRWEFSFFDVVSRITLLNKVNFPKIKQVTSHLGDLLSANASLYGDLIAYMDWAYPSVRELLDLRIEAYSRLLDAVELGGSAALDGSFHETLLGYYDDIAFPRHAVQGDAATLDMLEISPQFACFLLQKADGTVILIRPENVPHTVRECDAPYKFKATFTMVSLAENARHSPPDNENVIADIDSYQGELLWDGRTVRVYVKNAIFTKKLLFSGSGS